MAIRMGAPFTCVNLNYSSCSAAKDKLLISATGEIYPCEAFKSLRGTRPTIYTSNLQEVWKNDPLLYALRTLDNEGVQFCYTCALFDKCNGGCPGQRMLANGNMKIGPDPLCTIMSTDTLVNFGNF